MSALGVQKGTIHYVIHNTQYTRIQKLFFLLLLLLLYSYSFTLFLQGCFSSGALSEAYPETGGSCPSSPTMLVCMLLYYITMFWSHVSVCSITRVSLCAASVSCFHCSLICLFWFVRLSMCLGASVFACLCCYLSVYGE